jgi:predicted RNA-binding Zn ribbon-like protein
VLQEVRAFREAGRTLLEASLGEEGETEPALREINQHFARLGPPMLASRGGFSMGYHADEPGVALLIPLLRAGLDFFAGTDLSRVRRCNNPACVLYFLDSTKSGTRRWCRMETCGNVLKARAHRSRHRDNAAPETKCQEGEQE